VELTPRRKITDQKVVSHLSAKEQVVTQEKDSSPREEKAYSPGEKSFPKTERKRVFTLGPHLDKRRRGETENKRKSRSATKSIRRRTFGQILLMGPSK